MFFSSLLSVPEPIKFKAFKVCVKMPGYQTDCFDTDNLIYVDIAGKKIDIYANKDMHYDLVKITSGESADHEMVINIQAVDQDANEHKIVLIMNSSENKETGEAARLLISMAGKDILYRLKNPY